MRSESPIKDFTAVLVPVPYLPVIFESVNLALLRLYEYEYDGQLVRDSETPCAP